MKITIEKIVYPGQSLARVDGRVIFTDHGLPGEEVEVETIKETTGYIQAKTIKVINKSEHRIDASCSHYPVCSSYQYIDYKKQVEIKKEQIAEIAKRQLKQEAFEFEFRTNPQTLGYRNKVKLNVIWKDKLPHLAYNVPQEIDKFIKIEECSLLPELTNSFFKGFLKVLGEKPFRSINQLVVRENSKKELLIAVYHNAQIETYKAIEAFKPLFEKYPLAGFVLVDQLTHVKTAIWGHDFFEEEVKGIKFCVGAGSFFQINTGMLNVLVDDLLDNLNLNQDMIVTDLYCGVGVFGMLLASKVKQVIGVETEAENFYFMEQNIKLNNIENFDVKFCDCEDAIGSLLRKKIDLAIIDPPRKGMEKSVCRALERSGPEKIVYISCNPMTLTRDLKILLSAYEIKKTYVYDFFPNTPHIETMVILDRKMT